MTELKKHMPSTVKGEGSSTNNSKNSLNQCSTRIKEYLHRDWFQGFRVLHPCVYRCDWSFNYTKGSPNVPDYSIYNSRLTWGKCFRRQLFHERSEAATTSILLYLNRWSRQVSHGLHSRPCPNIHPVLKKHMVSRPYSYPHKAFPETLLRP